ncbi:MAG: hypothetical protein OHK0038_12740 [Flammeovirgaceae bacterium]
MNQVDEFMRRFNFEIDLEGNPIEAEKRTTELRQHYILSLFDENYLQKADKNQKENILRFLEDIAVKQKLFLHFHDSNWFAEAQCKVIYKGKTHPLFLILKTEKTKKGISKWSICSVKADFLTISPNDSSITLSPISHEMNFSKLLNISKESPNNVSSLADSNFEEDEKNIFFFLLKNKELEIIDIQTKAFYFLQANGWIWTVRHFERASENVGWLIEEIIPANDLEKEIWKKEKF